MKTGQVQITNLMISGSQVANDLKNSRAALKWWHWHMFCPPVSHSHFKKSVYALQRTNRYLLYTEHIKYKSNNPSSSSIAQVTSPGERSAKEDPSTSIRPHEASRSKKLLPWGTAVPTAGIHCRTKHPPPSHKRVLYKLQQSTETNDSQSINLS